MLLYAQSSVSCFKQHKFMQCFSNMLEFVQIVCIAGMAEMSAPLHTARQQSVSLATTVPAPHSLSAQL